MNYGGLKIICCRLGLWADNKLGITGMCAPQASPNFSSVTLVHECSQLVWLVFDASTKVSVGKPRDRV